VVEQTDDRGSTVFVMIETPLAIENIDSIAAVDGVEVLLIGSNDLSIELRVPGQFETKKFQ
jgi:2-keto-3-deoxy-L-rhamnonate aldolase RhmA